MKHDGENCKNCGRPYTQVYTVPDHIWDRVMGSSGFENHTFCIECFDYLAGLIKVHPYWTCGDGAFPTVPDSAPVDEETWIRETAEEILAEDAHVSEWAAFMKILRQRLPLLRGKSSPPKE